MKTREGILLGIGFSAVLISCSTTPDRIDELEQARTTVQHVETSPDAGKYAADEIQAAHESLRKADRMADGNKSTQAIIDEAYIARRHAEIANEQIARGQAREAAANAESERQKVLLEAREREAAQRQREAQAREAEARRLQQRAREQALAAQAGRAQAEAEAQVARANADKLADELRDLKARDTERGLVLTLGDVLFDTDKAVLKPGAQATMDRLAEFLKESPQRDVTIEGHTDSTGPDAYNQMLSLQRASAVKSALVERGIKSARVDTVGKGESRPVATNDTAAGRQQNRRVEIVISRTSEMAAR